jgi:hypothetical protein
MMIYRHGLAFHILYSFGAGLFFLFLGPFLLVTSYLGLPFIVGGFVGIAGHPDWEMFTPSSRMVRYLLVHILALLAIPLFLSNSIVSYSFFAFIGTSEGLAALLLGVLLNIIVTILIHFVLRRKGWHNLGVIPLYVDWLITLVLIFLPLLPFMLIPAYDFGAIFLQVQFSTLVQIFTIGLLIPGLWTHFLVNYIYEKRNRPVK